jgi:outer membrane murein-binding lipoprotein Lpp
MADEEKNKGEKPDEFDSDDFGALSGGQDDDGLGNLPPLSEFESSEGTGSGSDANLPPLGSISSGSSDPESQAGLPPISDIPVETPVPTGGNIQPPPAGFDSTPSIATPSSDDGLDTPLSTPSESPSTGFQDLSADSDFTPETPEIGPGPDSDLETPMFDSAFGAGESEFGSTPDTSAPTQAMETPMFGADSGAAGASTGETVGFDEGAFAGVGGDDLAAGTPIPDFSPDTGVPASGGPATPPPAAAAAASGGGGGGILVTVGVAIVCLAVGLILPRFLGDSVPFLQADSSKVSDLEGQVSQLEEQVIRLQGDGVSTGVSREELDKMLNERDALNAEITDLSGQQGTLSADVENLRGEFELIEADIEASNEEFAIAQTQYEDLQNQLAITSARRDGLDTEVDRLQSLVGQYNDANARRVATKDALLHHVNQLEIHVREQLPLTPAGYSLTDRMAAVEVFKQKAESRNWASPDLLDEFMEIVKAELQIASTNQYFFARIPVKDRFGQTTMQWAECLMNGSHSVYYRSLDGHSVGTYENVSAAGAPQYAFRDQLPKPVREAIEKRVMSSRTPNYEEKLATLAGLHGIDQTDHVVQRVFDSL